MKIGEKTINIDPLILFTRLTAIVHRERDPIEQFSYELTPEPSSLFKDGLMRKPLTTLPYGTRCWIKYSHQKMLQPNRVSLMVVHYYIK